MRWILAIAVAVLAVRAQQLSIVPSDDDRTLAEAAAVEPGGRVLYQYVGDAGRVRLVERLDAVPAAKRAEAGRIVMSERPSPAVAPSGAWASARRRTAPPPVAEVFTSDRCPYCDDQLRALAAAGIHYRERNIDRDPAAARELAGHARRRPVPTTVAAGRTFVGFNPQQAAQIRHALEYEAAGGEGPLTVELYTQATCGYSRRLMAELDRLGVAYVNHDIDREPAARARLVALTGSPGVPVATVGADLLPGWSPGRAREIQARAEPGWSWWPF